VALAVVSQPTLASDLRLPAGTDRESFLSAENGNTLVGLYEDFVGRSAELGTTIPPANDSEAEIPIFTVPDESCLFLTSKEAIDFVKSFASSAGFSISVAYSNDRSTALQCIQGGKYRSHKKSEATMINDGELEDNHVARSLSLRFCSTRKGECPYKVFINYSKKSRTFSVVCKCGSHNHGPIPKGVFGVTRMNNLIENFGDLIREEIDRGSGNQVILGHIRRQSRCC